MAAAPSQRTQEPLVGVVGWPQQTNVALVDAWHELGVPAVLMGPEEARTMLVAGDVAVGRFDVLPTLDGVEPGLHVLERLARRGVRVLNGVETLLDAHDKLRTAKRLAASGVPHPRTVHHPAGSDRVELALPFVLKPRYGSWGIDVFRCETEEDVERVLLEVEHRPWFVRQGAVLQELVPPVGLDLRVVLARGSVVGAVERVARPGEWRTNVSLGAARRQVEPPASALELAIAAAEAIRADLVGVDLLPVDGGYVVLELNGAVEFDRNYDLLSSSAGVYAEAATALGLVTRDRPRVPAPAP